VTRNLQSAWAAALLLRHRYVRLAVVTISDRATVVFSFEAIEAMLGRGGRHGDVVKAIKASDVNSCSALDK